MPRDTAAEKFEEVQIGEQYTSHGRTVSESDVYRYAGLEGHYGELHTNREKMNDSEYGQRIAHGGLLVVLTNGFMTKLPFHHDVVALYGLDSVRFVNPVFIDDTVHLEAEVVDKEPKGENGGIVTYNCELRKTDGTLAMALEWLYMIRGT